jgi:hypothetical protein
MNTPIDNDGTKKSVRSLRELSMDIPPPRDLWPSISAEISKSAQTAGGSGKSGSRAMPSRMQWLALAAMVATLAIGMWLGRTFFPVSGASVQTPPVASTKGPGTDAPQNVINAAYLQDPRYIKQHAELVRSLDEKMKTLPPDTQKKVVASLDTIRKSIADIQAALGKDPGNALLQGLLVNSYQDEMRVLTAVHEAGDSGREI